MSGNENETFGGKRPDPEKPRIDESIWKLVSTLGPKETDAMRDVREQIDKAGSGDELRVLIRQYQDFGQQEVDRYPDETRPRAQIGLILASAAIYSRNELTKAFSREAVQDAIDYAENMGDAGYRGYARIARSIRKILKSFPV